MPSNSSLVKNLITGLLLSASLPVVAAGYQVTTIASGLDKPWSIAQLPDGAGFLVTEKSGQLLHISDAGESTSIAGVPPVYFKSQGGLRVGADTREARRGEGWAFDDSVSHEAWNNGSSPRTILLFDVWRPELDASERHLITTILEAVSGFGKVA